MKRDVSHIFNKFAGREVPMTETPKTYTIFEETFTETRVDLADKNDPTLQEMQKVAKDNGLSLRVFWPTHMMGTADYRMDRVNATIEKGADGKYRVSNKFDIG